MTRRAQCCEQCWPLVGLRRGGLWCAKRLRRSVGQPTRVEFNGPAVLAREERRGDVVGFLHTHPGFRAQPSRRDIATMQAWVSAFGKPLVCLIDGTDGLAGFLFDADNSQGKRIAQVERFPGGLIVIAM
jgi:hypothetical protein